MTFTTAGKRVWSPKGRPKPLARHNGYSHAEGGVATSYSAFGAFGARVNSLLLSALLFAGVLIVPAVSVAQVTAPGTAIRNVGTVAYQAPGGVATLTNSNEVSLTVQPLPSRASITLARYQAGSQTTSTAGPTQCRSSNGFFPLDAAAVAGPGRARSHAADSDAGHRHRARRRPDLRARGRSRPQSRRQRHRNRRRAHRRARDR